MKTKYTHITKLLIIVLLLTPFTVITMASDTATVISCKQIQDQDSINNLLDKAGTQIIVIKEEREANNQHDWVFYIMNIIITSLLTLLINYLNSRFEIIKMQKEPSINRLKTISIEGIKTEKKIYTDLKSAQEHLSYNRKEEALSMVNNVSNYLEENKMDIKTSLYTYATDIISYITSVVMGKETRSEQRERELFDIYYKDYRK